MGRLPTMPPIGFSCTLKPVEGSATRPTAQQSSPAGTYDCWIAKKLAQHRSSSRVSAKKLAQPGPTSGTSAKKLAQHRSSSRVSPKKLAQHRSSSRVSAKNFARQAQKCRIWGVMSEQGELFRARTHIRSSRANFFAQTPTTRPRRANFFAHRTQPRGDDATNDTSTATGSGQHETTITTARP